MEEDIDPAYLRQLERAFATLKPKHQRLILMRRVDGLSYAEIAVTQPSRPQSGGLEASKE